LWIIKRNHLSMARGIWEFHPQPLLRVEKDKVRKTDEFPFRDDGPGVRHHRRDQAKVRQISVSDASNNTA
jgi:hypothetical protein